MLIDEKKTEKMRMFNINKVRIFIHALGNIFPLYTLNNVGNRAVHSFFLCADSDCKNSKLMMTMKSIVQ